MGVGRVGGKKGASGAGGAKGAGSVGKAGGAGFADKVGKSESLVGPSRMAGTANVAAADPVTAQALDIARQLKTGQIKTKEEATRKLVADILREKVRMQSKALTARISETLTDDPRLQQALERLWAQGGNKER
jgi:hypothetical protein